MNHAYITPEATLESSDYAQASEDGHLVSMSRHAEPHRRYGFDAFAAEVSIPLTTGQQKVLADVRAGAGEVRFSIRSTLAQPGIDGFDPETLAMRMAGNSLIVKTFLTDWREQTGSRMLGILRNLAEKQMEPKMVRLALLPSAARMKVAETGLPRAGTDEWTVALPVAHAEYRILEAAITEKSIAAMLGNGSARKHLEKIRHRSPERPDAIPGGEFFLGEVDAPELPYDLILRQHTQARDGSESSAVHGHSCLFDAGRRHKQLEMLNTSHKPVALEGLKVLAYGYHTKKTTP